jgi:transcription antitermination factor NusG
MVNELLGKKTIDVFLPLVHVQSRRTDRKVMLDLPLFPGYVFVKTDLHPDHYLSILKTPGAVKLIGNKDGPVPVDAPVIESLKIMVSSGETIITDTLFKRGEKVRVINGPFSGVRGIFSTYKGKGHVIVFVEILGQSASVEVSVDDIERIA